MGPSIRAFADYFGGGWVRSAISLCVRAPTASGHIVGRTPDTHSVVRDRSPLVRQLSAERRDSQLWTGPLGGHLPPRSRGTSSAEIGNLIGRPMTLKNGASARRQRQANMRANSSRRKRTRGYAAAIVNSASTASSSSSISSPSSATFPL
jgi:hypothetical protein